MKTIAIILLLTMFHFGCSQNPDTLITNATPENTGDGLKTGSLPEAGLDLHSIQKAVIRIENGKFGEIHSMLIYKDSLLVFEDYFQGHRYRWDAPGHHDSLVQWNRGMQHCSHSVTKSIVSLCIGIAIDKGFIESVHQSIFDYLPNYQHLRTPEKESITIEHLLTMTSGLQWAEWSAPLSSIANDQVAIWFHETGPINFALGRPLVAAPGNRFNYSGGDMQILAEILYQATGMNLDAFSGRYLFEPLGIDSYEWWLVFRSGEIHAAGGLMMTPRDMIKIGAMMLNNGKWNGLQIIPTAWVEKSMFPREPNAGIKVPGEDLGRMGYGYTWWTKEINFRGNAIHWFSANGWGGQKIIVLPELKMVIVFTGGRYTHKVKEYTIVERYILPAVLTREE